jgi:hypothetical protein
MRGLWYKGPTPAHATTKSPRKQKVREPILFNKIEFQCTSCVPSGSIRSLQQSSKKTLTRAQIKEESKLIKLLEGGIIIPQKQKQQYTKNENTK